MQHSASEITISAGGTSERTTAASAASAEASASVETVAAAAEELAGSIAEISRQVAHSAPSPMPRWPRPSRRPAPSPPSPLAGEKIRRGVAPDRRHRQPDQPPRAQRDDRGGARRRGGQGFAVVAARSRTSPIKRRRRPRRSPASHGDPVRHGNCVAAIGEISRRSARSGQIATTIAAAVEEQGAATQEIARNAPAGRYRHYRRLDTIAGQPGRGQSSELAARVLDAAGDLSRHGTALAERVDSFLAAYARRRDGRCRRAIVSRHCEGWICQPTRSRS